VKYFVLFLIISLAVVACQPLPQNNPSASLNKFADPEIRTIYTWQDERKMDSLLPYLHHQNPVYRSEAALAFASVQDKKAISDLSSLLMDKQALVRKAAAYALGQISDPATEPLLIEVITRETAPAVKAEMLEALGKCATQKGLDFLSTLVTSASDQVIKAGQAWGLYRTNAKDLNYAQAIATAAQMLSADNSQPARLGAAHFLARTPRLDLTGQLILIISAAQSDPSAEVRMAAAQALGKIKSSQVTSTLLELVQQDPDYRVQINALRALNNAEFSRIKEVVYESITYKNPNMALAAADFLLAKAPAAEANQLLERAKRATNWRVRATLFGAVLKLHANNPQVQETIRKAYAQTTNLYEKAALLSALSQDISAYPFIQKVTFSGTSPVLASYGMQALADMRHSKAFPAAFKETFVKIFRQGIESEDRAVIGIAAGVLQNPELNFREAYPDYTFLKTTRDKLTLPQDMETYLELEKTIHFFQGTSPVSNVQNPFNHPIDWQVLQKLPRNQQVQLTTTKGNITLQLMVEEAPGSVANFVALTQRGFFNGKNFHRVVPNFVVQGGDPRGDGWGGTNYSLRSEFANLRYLEGYVGMASAGKNTESCQWFITHSPTPHLDGRYTIFAKVTAGMEVVHQLEIGDNLATVELVK